MSEKIFLSKKMIEEGVEIYVEGLPGNPTNVDCAKGLGLYIHKYAGDIEIHGWSGGEEPLFSHYFPELEPGDKVLVDRTRYANAFLGTIVSVDLDKGILGIEDKNGIVVGNISWNRVYLMEKNIN